jgi:hypothetical protein
MNVNLIKNSTKSLLSDDQYFLINSYFSYYYELIWNQTIVKDSLLEILRSDRKFWERYWQFYHIEKRSPIEKSWKYLLFSFRRSFEWNVAQQKLTEIYVNQWRMKMTCFINFSDSLSVSKPIPPPNKIARCLNFFHNFSFV